MERRAGVQEDEQQQQGPAQAVEGAPQTRPAGTVPVGILRAEGIDPE